MQCYSTAWKLTKIKGTRNTACKRVGAGQNRSASMETWTRTLAWKRGQELVSLIFWSCSVRICMHIRSAHYNHLNICGCQPTSITWKIMCLLCLPQPPSLPDRYLGGWVCAHARTHTHTHTHTHTQTTTTKTKKNDKTSCFLQPCGLPLCVVCVCVCVLRCEDRCEKSPVREREREGGGGGGWISTLCVIVWISVCVCVCVNISVCVWVCWVKWGGGEKVQTVRSSIRQNILASSVLSQSLGAVLQPTTYPPPSPSRFYRQPALQQVRDHSHGELGRQHSWAYLCMK